MPFLDEVGVPFVETARFEVKRATTVASRVAARIRPSLSRPDNLRIGFNVFCTLCALRFGVCVLHCKHSPFVYL
jgi:hypothetical protein